MTDRKPNENAVPEDELHQNTAAKSQAAAPTEAEPKIAKQLTPEEQMALYEKDLKENDWGHQPC